MYKIINLFFVIVFFLFFFIVYNYYSSNKNIKTNNLNRSNIKELVRSKNLNIPILKNDTNDVIKFNDSFAEEIKDNKKRNFWNLLKSK
tara:strand:- start:231 stop:494 length:264 start_codon:yes stop_codon:yes gene_type:complete